MKTQVSLSFWRRIGSWALTIAPIVVCIFAYFWVALFFVADDGKSLNLLLGLMAFFGANTSHYVVLRLCRVHHLTTWPKVREISFWMYVVLLSIVLWHVAGWLFASTPDAQLFFAHNAYVVLAMFVILAFIKFLMEAPGAAKEHKV
jgi:hypothetical protein